MYPNRRRKKRPNYGLRTVEVIRGSNGFGFTISGQQPCILSCIVSNSPADQAGLRAGDFLISINGISVSKMAHDAVVSLIGNCVDPIKMTIAENYYSDSSDEELECGRMIGNRKPKYMHKPRQCRRLQKNGLESNTKPMEKFRENLNKPLLNTNIFNNQRECHEAEHESLNISHPVAMDNEAGPIEFKALVGYLGTIEMPKQLLPSSRLHTVCICIKKLRQEKRSPTIVLMTILPTCLTLKNSSNHIIAIYPTNRVVYVGSTTEKESRYFGLVTSAVCDNRDQNSPNLGQNSDVDVSNSCHVFVIDPKIVEHRLHVEKAENFKIICTPDAVTGSCLEFPESALYIVNLVQTMYKLQNDTPIKNDLNNPLLANSPQPSASSNSDSGIGYRDDCGNISDRILVVEFPTHRPLPAMNNTNRPQGIDGGDLSLNAFDFRHNKDPHFELNNKLQYRQNNIINSDDGDSNKQTNNLNNIRACENIKNTFEHSASLLQKQNNNLFKENNRLTCRALLDTDIKSLPYSSSKHYSSIKYGNVDSGQIFSEHPVDVPFEDITNIEFSNSIVSSSMPSTSFLNNEFKTSVDNVSVQSSKSGELSNLVNIFRMPFETKKLKKPVKIASSCENIETCQDNPKTYDKLSPKVYGVPKANYSCEELNNTELFEDKLCYGSLQDLSNWAAHGQPRRNIAQSEPDVRIHRKTENVFFFGIIPSGDG